MIEYVRKGSKLPENMKEAQQRVEQIEEQYKYAVEAKLGHDEHGDTDSDEEDLEEDEENDDDEEEEEEEEKEKRRLIESNRLLETIGEEDVSSR
ncbi:unnamed protein product [Anisakis simplex]|uniref:Prothymosin alpha n=1 Tax=Anisakis simplex TaxID=6269 RepID=A0A0M3JF21_ANISI|nr:unnamed protein product [Anisakis simplex]